MLPMKRMLLVSLSMMILVFLPISVLASEAPASPSPSPTPGASASPSPESGRTFSTVGIIEAPQPESGPSTAGLVLWGLLLAAVVFILCYMACSMVRIRREEKKRRMNEALRPKLVITRGFTRRK